jgi:putative lipoprotein
MFLNTVMRTKAASHFFLMLVFLLTACADDGDTPSAEESPVNSSTVPTRPPGKTYVYECPDEFGFAARIEGETAWLFLPSGTISLPHVPAASGAKYQDGATIYWSKGEVAVLERADQTRVECINNRAKAIWEDAKLRGADFRATGNEPGWHLEISRGYGIVFVTNYGSDRYTFRTPAPISNEESRSTSYAVNENGHELAITLEGRRCTDSMSGAQFETTVTVMLDGTRFAGCGRPLH